jgi:hypothetical protein
VSRCGLHKGDGCQQLTLPSDPAVRARDAVDVVEARSIGGYRVHLRFDDGVEADLDFGELIRFEGSLRRFATRRASPNVRVDPELGSIWWPGGADLDPDVLIVSLSGTE